MERRRLSLLALRPDNKSDDGGNESVMLSDESRKTVCGQGREFARYRISGKKNPTRMITNWHREIQHCVDKMTAWVRWGPRKVLREGGTSDMINEFTEIRGEN